jgi:hypothetical protein
VECKSNTLIGNFHNPDFPGALWFNWWLGHSIKNHLDFFHTDYLSYPFGENLWCSMGNFLNIFLFYPINKIWGLIKGFNFTAFIILLLNCLAGFTLINIIVKNKSLAFLGGFIIGINQFTLRELNWGRLDQLAIFWFAFFLWALVKLKNSKSPKFIWVTALFFALTTLGSFHYGIISSILIFTWSILALFKKDFRFFKKIFSSVIVGILILSPFLLVFLKEFTSEYYLPLTNVDLFHEYYSFLQIMTDHSLDPIASFSFSPHVRWKFDLVKISPFLFILSLIFLVKNWRKKDILYWNVLWIISIILAVGPLLQFNHRVVKLDFRVILLPYYFLAKFVPFFSRFFWPYRFLLVFWISGVVIIMIAIKDWYERVNKFKRSLFHTGIIFYIFLELSFYSCYTFPFQTTKIKIPVVYYMLKKLPEGVVLELPYCFGQNDLVYIYYQTIHGRKLLNSSFGLSPLIILPAGYREFLREFDLSKDGIFIKNEKDLEYLKNLGIRYIVFNENRALRNLNCNYFLLKKMEARLMELLGKPAIFSPSERIFLFVLY